MPGAPSGRLGLGSRRRRQGIRDVAGRLGLGRRRRACRTRSQGERAHVAGARGEVALTECVYDGHVVAADVHELLRTFPEARGDLEPLFS